ncbi:Mut7-C ubiquitin/RNAse domain-containing protein [candidate division KSB1 bacterium]|nr:Mut7-C ubiquitin/RNAse domain-containing protein [candidate division KSB1 bacterium]
MQKAADPLQKHRALFRFYEELNDFIPLENRKKRFIYFFNGNPAIKDAIEANGVPHTEVDLILVNGRSVGFDYQLQQDDDVAVYPVFESMDISKVTKLRRLPLRNPTFILDVHLGKLARLLRLFGFDSLYRNDFTDPQIIRIAKQERRIIITRDRGILKNSSVTHGFYPRSTNPREQLLQVLQRFDLFSQLHPFQRCISCNGKIHKVDKSQIVEKLPPKVAASYDVFFRCQHCRKIYWQGSHFEKLSEYVQHVKNFL